MVKCRIFTFNLKVLSIRQISGVSPNEDDDDDDNDDDDDDDYDDDDDELVSSAVRTANCPRLPLMPSSSHST